VVSAAALELVLANVGAVAARAAIELHEKLAALPSAKKHSKKNTRQRSFLPSVFFTLGKELLLPSVFFTRQRKFENTF
jgi:hypothetical protein